MSEVELIVLGYSLILIGAAGAAYAMFRKGGGR